MRRTFSSAVGLVGIALAAAVSAPANAVIGGDWETEAGPNVAIRTSKVACSGTLLSARWVLTSQFCLNGATEKFDGATGKIHWGHPNPVNAQEASYSKVVTEGGLAMLKLDKDLPAGAVAYPSVGDADPPMGAMVTFFGFGETGVPGTPPELKFGSALVVEPAGGGRGDGLLGPSWTSFSNGNGITTEGDWGGGAYVDDKLVGVAATPAIDGTNFASVPAHRTFIIRTLAETRPDPR